MQFEQTHFCRRSKTFGVIYHQRNNLLSKKDRIDHEPVTKESTVGDDREPTTWSSPTSEWIRIEAAKLHFSRLIGTCFQIYRLSLTSMRFLKSFPTVIKLSTSMSLGSGGSKPFHSKELLIVPDVEPESGSFLS